MKSTFILLMSCFCAAESVSQAADSIVNSKRLLVNIEALRSLEDRAEFDLSVCGNNESPIRVSRFNLVGLLRAGKFKELQGNRWGIAESGVIADPPPPEMDFTFLVEPTKTNRVTIVTRPLKKLPTQERIQDLSAEPSELQYELSREVGTINATNRIFAWVECQGAGTVKVHRISGVSKQKRPRR
jgi:hypothetical protein